MGQREGQESVPDTVINSTYLNYIGLFVRTKNISLFQFTSWALAIAWQVLSLKPTQCWLARAGGTCEPQASRLLLGSH